MADTTSSERLSNTSPYKATSTDTRGAFSVIEVVTLPGEGPRIHSHANEDEGFYVLEGVYRFWIGDAKSVDVLPGVHVFGPRNIPHRFENIGHTPGKLLLIFAPAGFESYFKDLEAAREKFTGSQLLEEEEAIDTRYGITMNRRS